MKKKYKQAIHSQARTLERLVGEIKSIKRSRKTDGGVVLSYPRRLRREIQYNIGVYYMPTNIQSVIKGMSDLQKATVLRAVARRECGLGFNHSCREKTGRQWRIHGNYHSVKESLCYSLFFTKLEKFAASLHEHQP
jgi:hypothetical protein